MLSNQSLLDLVNERLPEFHPVDSPTPIAGGNLNHLWRLTGKTNTLVAKYAPPHIAANPEIPLTSDRIHFEARALELFSESGRLAALASEDIRPPLLVDFIEEADLLLMEDLGRLPSVDEWISLNPDVKTGQTLGRFIGMLHRQTCGRKELAEQFNNRPIQQSRYQIQYRSAGDYAREGGLSAIRPLQKKTEKLGKQLLKPGHCLIMGDLWPPSILVDNGNLRIIDWEFSHYGHPLQDVAHFAAHCWMQRHAADSEPLKKGFLGLWEAFIEAYLENCGDEIYRLFKGEYSDHMGTHFGAEILMRAAGPFKEGYVYENISPAHPKLAEALDKACKMIRDTEFRF